MLVDFRPTGRLRGSKPVNVTAALCPVVDALAADSVDLSRVCVVSDWSSTAAASRRRRHPADSGDPLRRLGAGAGAASGVMIKDEMEVTIDVRCCCDVPLRELTGELLRACFGDAGPSRIDLEPWLATSVSGLWEFNALVLDGSGPVGASHRPPMTSSEPTVEQGA